MNEAAPSYPQSLSPQEESQNFHRIASERLRLNQVDSAIEPLRQAIRLRPDFAAAHGDLGVAFARLGRLSEAEACFRMSIRLAPLDVTMYVNLATCLHQQGRPQDVEEWARQALLLHQGHAEAHRLLAASLEQRQRLDLAETEYREALKADPRHAESHAGVGRLSARLNRHVEAELAFREAVRSTPTLAHAWSGLGNALDRQQKLAEALEAHRKACDLEPSNHDRHNNYGVALAALERHTEAETAYRKAIELEPNNASAWSNLGNALRLQDKLSEAEQSLRKALEFFQQYPEAHNNLGIVLVQAGRHEEGLTHYDEAIRLRPHYPEARMNRSLSWLAQGDFRQGWPEYEWRLQLRKSDPDTIARWDGSDFAGKTLLITAEQGLGDCLQFLRYAQAAKARGGTILFDCPPPIASLARTCPGIDEVIPRGQPMPPHDLQIPLLSLPQYLGNADAAGLATIPYYSAPTERVAHWTQRLAPHPGFRVGIAWQGSTAHKGDRLRSVKLTRFAGLGALPGVQLVSFQKGFGNEQLTDGSCEGLSIIDLGSEFDTDMTDAAAALQAIDLLITVDTALAHLAGSLGRPCWVATPFAADWRWLREREDTPWYPSMTLFRQRRPDDWDHVFGRITARLAARLRKSQAAA